MGRTDEDAMGGNQCETSEKISSGLHQIHEILSGLGMTYNC